MGDVGAGTDHAVLCRQLVARRFQHGLEVHQAAAVALAGQQGCAARGVGGSAQAGQAQAITARSPELRAQMVAAAREETDHLAWTAERLNELGSRPSVLNPLWYAGAFGIGLLAGKLGDAVSLGFVVDTERQVAQPLAGHLDRLPAADQTSRAIVEQMKVDEAQHADAAEAAGATLLPAPARWLMRAAAKVMTTVAHRI